MLLKKTKTDSENTYSFLHSSSFVGVRARVRQMWKSFHKTLVFRFEILCEQLSQNNLLISSKNNTVIEMV